MLNKEAIKKSIEQELAQEKAAEEEKKKEQDTELQERERKRVESEHSKNLCFLNFNDYLIKCCKSDKHFKWEERPAISSHREHRGVEPSPHKIFVSCMDKELAEMYRDNSTPENSVKLQLHRPNKALYIIHVEFLNEFTSDWQYHLRKDNVTIQTFEAAGNMQDLFDTVFS